MKHAKATKTEVLKVMDRLSHANTREELVNAFLEDCVTTTCAKCLEAYGEDEGMEKCLEFLSDLYKKDFITEKFYSKLSIALALSDLLSFITKEGDDNG